MSFLTERKLANTLDVPVSLPATEIKMSDWLVLATIKLDTPSKLTYRMLHLNFISSTFTLGYIKPQNRISANGGLCYIGLYYNYVSGDPGSFVAMDIVKATDLGVVTRTANALVSALPGTYSWIAVNNVQYSADNALLTAADSADFRLSCTGQCRIELDLTQ